MPPTDDEMADWEAVSRRIKDAVQEVLTGTPWGPASGEGVVIDAVVIAGWADTTGRTSSSMLFACTDYAAEGLITRALRVAEDDEDPDV